MKNPFVPFKAQPMLSDAEMQTEAEATFQEMNRRRTIRDFASEPVPKAVIEWAIRTADTAPSGANEHPWHFVAVSDPEIKRQIREAAEEEERDFYERRAPDEWLQALAPLGTDAEKPFLEDAPWLVVVFARTYGLDEQGKRIRHYYVQESVGIATGMLITALHRCRLATLTHTPSPMRFLNKILGRPDNERPFVLLVTGHPAAGTKVPDIGRKELREISTFLEPTVAQGARP